MLCFADQVVAGHTELVEGSHTSQDGEVGRTEHLDEGRSRGRAEAAGNSLGVAGEAEPHREHMVDSLERERERQRVALTNACLLPQLTTANI